MILDLDELRATCDETIEVTGKLTQEVVADLIDRHVTPSLPEPPFVVGTRRTSRIWYSIARNHPDLHTPPPITFRWPFLYEQTAQNDELFFFLYNGGAIVRIHGFDPEVHHYAEAV